MRRGCAPRWLAPWLAVSLVVACGPTTTSPSSQGANVPTGPMSSLPKPASTPPVRAKKVIPRSLARGDGGPIDDQLAEGDRLYAAERFADAAQTFAAAAEKAPADPAPYVGWARSKLAEEKVPEGVNAAPDDATAQDAAKKLSRATALDPDHALGQLELGRVLLVLGRLTDAVPPLERAARLGPDDAEAQSALGIALLLTGRPEDGAAALRRAAELEPERADRHSNLGTALLQIGDATGAVVAYSRAVQLEPEVASHRSNLGTAFLQQSDFESALPHLEKAVALEPDRATFLSNLGFAQLATGDRERAIATFERALELDPELASAWINLGNAHAKGGDYAEARKAYAHAKQLDPDDPRVDAVMKELDELETATEP